MHGVIAVWFSVAMLSDTHGWLVAAVAAVAITWMLNLYNFMDGSDGLAGGMTLIGFSCYGVTAWLAGNEPFAMINFCIAASAAAFLLFNFHPARIFMGDAGSIPLGFLAAALGIIGWMNGDWPLWLPLLVFSPFIADASVTLVKRVCAVKRSGRRIASIITSAWCKADSVIAIQPCSRYILMLAAGASAMWATRQDTAVQLGVGVAWCGIYLIMMRVSDRLLGTPFRRLIACHCT